MTKTTGRELRHDRGRRPRGGLRAVLRRAWPTALLLVLLIALLAPAAAQLAPGFTGPAPETAPPVPAWHQAPSTLTARTGLAALEASAPLPAAAAVRAQIDPLLKPDGGGNFTGFVQDALTGRVLFDLGGSANRVPASNMKLLTAVAALRSLGPERRFATSVVAGPGPGQVVLVGGGDVLLGAGSSRPDTVMGQAGLATLAEQTVESLRASGAAGKIAVLLDDSLFTGPALNPAWDTGDVEAGEVAPIYPVALNSGRYDPAVLTGPRPKDAALTAAGSFADLLRAKGKAAGLAVAPGVARVPAQAAGALEGQATLAQVESATVAEQVGWMLRTSDNYLAEALGRMTAVEGGLAGSHDAATAAVRTQVGEAGIPTDSMNLADVSGLAMGNQVTPRQVAEVVRAITSGTDPRLRAALDGFPVAGLTGTLDTRYGDDSTAYGAGLVRAKTGTLNTVLALSGYVVDADGRLLVFSFIGNGLTPGAAGNRIALDRAATALAACGCR
ncbi:D-alanyl-D-alanine carboxypeptidase/D-alanyl-D-alanine-endopeptidase [Pseudarthrobacter sp. NPDC092439]|uniref:D-alanyl-D-alanine carboxypeptidase/D-alanyl-D-alanine endopeptidase n=1 Tax=unclassified Pseudarthrobacter TaxID=2647000 RepID=UPI0037F47F1E